MRDLSEGGIGRWQVGAGKSLYRIPFSGIFRKCNGIFAGYFEGDFASFLVLSSVVQAVQTIAFLTIL